MEEKLFWVVDTDGDKIVLVMSNDTAALVAAALEVVNPDSEREIDVARSVASALHNRLAT